MTDEINNEAADFRDGIYFNMSDDEYHNIRRLSSSGLKKLLVSAPTFWRGSWLDPDWDSALENQLSPAKKFGRAYHAAILQPKIFQEGYIADMDRPGMPEGSLITGADMTEQLKKMGLPSSGVISEKIHVLITNGFNPDLIWHHVKEGFEKISLGKEILPSLVHKEIVDAAKYFNDSPAILELFAGGANEVSVLYTDSFGIEMKARFDCLTESHISDLKSFNNSLGKKIDTCLADIIRYWKCHIQAAVYREASEAIRRGGLKIIGDAIVSQGDRIASIKSKPDPLGFWFVFQEKGGVPNLVAREFPFESAEFTDAIDGSSDLSAPRPPSAIYALAQRQIVEAKKTFKIYSKAISPGEAWIPTSEAQIAKFSDDDFSQYWLNS